MRRHGSVSGLVAAEVGRWTGQGLYDMPLAITTGSHAKPPDRV